MPILDADQPLVLSSYSLGTTVSFAERVRIAAGAGFAGIGLRAENYWDAKRAGLDDASMLEILGTHGVRLAEVEYVTDWCDTRATDQQAKEQTIFHVARTFGVPHVNAGLINPEPLDAVVNAFAALCERARPLTVALEFLPFGPVPDLATVWKVVQDAGAANGGLLIDFWHWRRSGTTLDDLAPVPAERIVSVQIDDVIEHPMDPLRPEALHWRLPPGRGFGNVIELVRALRDKDVRPYVVSVEAMNDDLIACGLDTTARTLMMASRELLAQV
jgi:sugar phosphate isomerase/epimerase